MNRNHNNLSCLPLLALLAGLALALPAQAQNMNEDRLGVLTPGKEEQSILIIRDYYIQDAGDTEKKAFVITRNAKAAGANTVAPVMRDALSSVAGPDAESMRNLVKACHLNVCKQACDVKEAPGIVPKRLGGDIRRSCAGDSYTRVPDCSGDTATLAAHLCASTLPAAPLPEYPREGDPLDPACGSDPAWAPGAWGSCAADASQKASTCSNARAPGTRTRSAPCKADQGAGKVVADSCCRTAQPALTEACVSNENGTKTGGSCGSCSGSWSPGSWSSCSASSSDCCSGKTCAGEQTRTPSCSSGNCCGQKPSTSQSCSVTGTKTTGSCAPCTAWKTGKWRSCSASSTDCCSGKTCTGTQTRSVTCSGSNCCPRPSASKNCSVTGTKACKNCDGSWETGNWRSCNASSPACGRTTYGTQTRNVSCSGTNCCDSKPSASKSCSRTGDACPCEPCTTKQPSGCASPGSICAGKKKVCLGSVSCPGNSCTPRPATPFRWVYGTKSCCSGSWSPGSWSSCSAPKPDCDETTSGTQTRTPSCSSGNCCGSKPSPTSKSCKRTGGPCEPKCTGTWTPRTGTCSASASSCCKGSTCSGTRTTTYTCSKNCCKSANPGTTTASCSVSGSKTCSKAECTNGQSYCSAYTRYLCMNGKWTVIAHGQYACFVP